jgi:hypothetical protein
MEAGTEAFVLAKEPGSGALRVCDVKVIEKVDRNRWRIEFQPDHAAPAPLPAAGASAVVHNKHIWEQEGYSVYRGTQAATTALRAGQTALAQLALAPARARFSFRAHAPHRPAGPGAAAPRAGTTAGQAAAAAPDAAAAPAEAAEAAQAAAQPAAAATAAVFPFLQEDKRQRRSTDAQASPNQVSPNYMFH